ncbi:MAG: hypothetical protein ACO1PM_01595 [Acidovorax sp.]
MTNMLIQLFLAGARRGWAVAVETRHRAVSLVSLYLIVREPVLRASGKAPATSTVARLGRDFRRFSRFRTPLECLCYAMPGAFENRGFRKSQRDTGDLNMTTGPFADIRAALERRP